ncbi:MAG: 50S ribosomal protein L21 [Nitrospiraceae bacterium]|nr:50S ribosomal protein L21 [Nitrospiraceae bacterium]
MYAIIETGGKQYRVTSGQRLQVEKLDAEAGGEVVFDKVLAVSGEGDPRFGSPYLAGATVTADVLGAGKAKKVLIFRQKERKGMRRLRGHRQPYTDIKIKDIRIGG